jgi:hypothetical protein
LRGPSVVDPDHFANLNAVADIDADALAQFEESDEAATPIVGHRDLDNEARSPAQTAKSAIHCATRCSEALKRWRDVGAVSVMPMPREP